MKLLSKKQWLKGAMIIAAGTLLTTTKSFAAGPPKPSELNNSLAIVLLTVMIGLLLAIGLLAHVVRGAAEVYLEKLKEAKQKAASEAGKVVALIAFCLLSSVAFAQDAPAKAADAAASAPSAPLFNYGGLSATSFYTMVGIIVLELIVLVSLALQLKSFLAKEKPVVVAEAVEAKEGVVDVVAKWWSKMNSFRPVHEEVDMDLGHDYDGIRELDNKLPPWWLYGFYICVIFAGVYLYRFHVSHSAPSTQEEYQIAMAQADAEKEEYLKSAASKVDENSVALITDAASLAEGKKLFATNCSPCHGANAQGVVGPNLTDDYWLHGGGVKNVFKTIKYGVQEKGMKSWKDDFSPVQIAELASFIKSLHGSKPAGAKEPQGDLYTEEGKTTSDTTKTAVKKDVAKM
jgi:cytochrome c oxidase cbb3-type subunit III